MYNLMKRNKKGSVNVVRLIGCGVGILGFILIGMNYLTTGGVMLGVASIIVVLGGN